MLKHFVAAQNGEFRLMWCCFLHLSQWAELSVSGQEASCIIMHLHHTKLYPITLLYTASCCIPCVQFTSLQKEIDDHKEEIKKLQAETAKLNNIIRNLEKDIQGLKKEIQERDDTIQDKVS